MIFKRLPDTIWLLFALSHTVLAQTTTTTTSNTDQTTSQATTRTSSPTTPVSGSSFYPSYSSFAAGATPSSNDSAPNGNHNGSLNSTSLVQYYFVFLALLVCCLGLAIFFGLRRRSRLRAARARGDVPGGSALRRDGNGPSGGDGTTGRRRYRHGRWEEVGREEGLNEEGEAPPPYLPKRQSQEQQRSGEDASNEPAIPMETLSRDDVGLKPPDYTEAEMYGSEANTRGSVASASSSRIPDRPTNS